MAVYGLGGGADVAADLGASAGPVVAHPSAGLGHDRDGLHLGGDVVQRLFGLGDKGLGAQVRRGRLYRQTRYFFVGMILGAFVVAGTWLVIDFCTGKQGNFVLIW